MSRPDSAGASWGLQSWGLFWGSLWPSDPIEKTARGGNDNRVMPVVPNVKPYGMTRLEASDVDCAGCAENGRATAIYNIKKRAYRSLRKGKKAAARRHAKRRARREGKAQCALR